MPDPRGGRAWGFDGEIQGELVYFSYVALSTVDYGDVVPLSRPARAVAAFEGMVGQLYLAIIIARLVSLQTAR